MSDKVLGINNLDVNKIVSLAETIIGVGVASVTLRFSKEMVTIAFAMQGISVKIEVENEAIDLAVENVKKVIEKMRRQNE